MRRPRRTARIVIDQAPATERPMTSNQRRWLGALAEFHQVDRAELPELSASAAGQLIQKWAKSLPRETRKELGDQ
jgi:hypothetical protein